MSVDAQLLRFDGKVVVITGGGGSLGSAYALAFAARGASVVVSDVGASLSGSGQNSRVADVVVDKIKKMGGKAVADYNSVEEGEKVIETALREFGRVDIVVNNAGNLRDITFRKMKDEDWECVLRVHLLGAFKVTKAAWPHMLKQRYGRVIMTTSAAGLYGNFGQANVGDSLLQDPAVYDRFDLLFVWCAQYSSAKLALVGFAQTLAIEGAKHNICVNSIAPIANSRMLASVLPPDICKKFQPEQIAALVLYLTHEGCKETGATFELGAGWYSRLRWQRSKGLTIPPGKLVTPERIAAGWRDLSDFEKDPEFPTKTSDAYGPIMKHLEGPGSQLSRL